MSELRARWLLPAAIAAGTVVWLGAAALAGPARVMAALLVGVLPPLLLLQGTVSDDELSGLRPLGVYFSSLGLICALGLAAWWAGRASGLAPAEMGIVGLGAASALAWTGAVVLVAIGVLALGRALRWRETPLLELLLPRSALERAVFVLLALGAGVFEELAFRGFLIPALRVATQSTTLAVVLSSFAFGMMHGYQSVTGALRAGVLGAVLALPFLATGSLLPSMAAHALYDMLAGLVLADWALRRNRRH